MQRGRRPVSRWLFGHEKWLPPRPRVALFCASLVALGGTYAATSSEELQALTAFVLIFVVIPAISRRFGKSLEYAEAAGDRIVPSSVSALSAALLLPWCVLVFIVAPVGLGPWFWLWLLLWPWLELTVYLATRHFRRHGVEGFKRVRPLRDAALGGVATATLIGAIMLADEASFSAAVATGAASGVIGFLVVLTFTWSARRARI